MKAVFTAAHEKVYRALFAAHGLKTIKTTSLPEHTWMGTGVVRIGRSCPFDVWSHELGHYLVAAPDERRTLEWGLGSSPFAYSLTEASPGLSLFYTEDVEGMASALGIWIALRVEGRGNAAVYFENHRWCALTFRETTAELFEAGLMVRDKRRRPVPRCLVRKPLKRDVWRRR